jgi:hypothetical protein
VYVKSKIISNVEKDGHYYGENSEVVLARGTRVQCLSLETSGFQLATLSSARTDLNPVGDVREKLSIKLRVRYARCQDLTARGVATLGG